MTENSRGALFRVIAPDRHGRVTNAELFFDLVFVFAVTQLSHTLLHHFTVLGAVQVTLLFLAVWWVWVYTTWVTNWLDPEDAGPHPALPVDAWRARAVDDNSGGVRRTRPLVCHCLCGDAGRPHAVLAAGDAAASDPGAPQRDPHPGLAVRFRRVLDSWRPRRGREAALFLD